MDWFDTTTMEKATIFINLNDGHARVMSIHHVVIEQYSIYRQI